MARTTQPELAVSTSSSGRSAVGRSTAANLLISVRPGEWIKNTFVFAGLVFSRKLTDPAAVIASLTAFAIFCALAGAVYLINDVSDRERDRQHPRKRERPIASGALSPGTALWTAAVLAAGGLGASWMMGAAFGLVATIRQFF